MNEQIKRKIDTFFLQFHKQQYKKGEIMIRADEDPTAIFYLLDGLVKEYAITQKGDEVVVNIFKPPAFFPMSYAINKTENRFYFEAISSVSVVKAPVHETVAFVKREPDVMFNLLGRLYRGTDGLLTRLVYLMSGSAHARLITELLISAKRFGTKDSKGNVSLRLSESDLASRSGLSRETVSREMKKLKDNNLVLSKQKEIQIPDLTLLESALGGDY